LITGERTAYQVMSRTALPGYPLEDTDGLFIPREDPHQDSDWDTLIDLYRKDGLKMIRDHVRSLQRQDPACRKYPRFKVHDDIAAVAVRLEH
jgi:hypothetical protein